MSNATLGRPYLNFEILMVALNNIASGTIRLKIVEGTALILWLRFDQYFARENVSASKGKNLK
ncbi:hypothetical protein D918_09104 [Trichuris suis]|nr:hypothetical protein D918_09104 [Trichuris suis]